MTVDRFLVASIGGTDIKASDKPELKFQDYSAEVEALGIDPENAQEFLNILWDIMGRMVDLGMRVDVCGQFLDGLDEDFARAAEGVESEKHNETGDA